MYVSEAFFDTPLLTCFPFTVGRLTIALLRAIFCTVSQSITQYMKICQKYELLSYEVILLQIYTRKECSVSYALQARVRACLARVTYI